MAKLRVLRRVAGGRAMVNAPIGQSPTLPKPNDPCICKSGRKAKRCCLHQYHQKRAAALAKYVDDQRPAASGPLPCAPILEASGPPPDDGSSPC